MSEFKEYKPMEIEHNVKAAVENLRKAYWSNETKKVAKHYTEAEDIIISAICHHHYTVCKETTEGDLISREGLKKKFGKECQCDCSVCEHSRFDSFKGYYHCGLIDNAQAVDIKDQIAGAYNEGYMCGSREAEKARPKGEVIV